MANQFYLALDGMFHLEYGKNLLATSSRAQLQEMIKKDYPFFMNHKLDIQLCLNNMSCQIVNDIMESLGKTSARTFPNLHFLPKVLQRK